MEGIWVWIGFNAFVFLMLAIDLGVFHKEAHEVPVKEAAAWSAVWVTLSLSFAIGIYHFLGAQAGLEFVTGYLIEWALSVDNIFVFVLIFSYFGVPSKYQHRVLFWGILGALVMRGAMIGAGALLIERFHWILYVFGAFLVFTGIRMAFHDDETIEPENNPALKLLRRILPVTASFRDQKFLVREPAGPSGRVRLMATPLLIVLVVVETTDLIFAVDSIPAIFTITQDPFLVYTSNIFAILGLRALYFLLAGVIDRFHYLRVGLSIVLTFIGIKMLVADVLHIPTAASLGTVAFVLSAAAVASWLFPKAEVAPGTAAAPGGAVNAPEPGDRDAPRP